MRIGFFIATCCLATSALADCPPRPTVTPLESEAMTICQDANYEPLKGACIAFVERERAKNLQTNECEGREAIARMEARQKRDLEIVKKATEQ